MAGGDGERLFIARISFFGKIVDSSWTLVLQKDF